ncbi:MerR family transcriptional regulator [Pseudomarimonas arenosa]|uniref:MerR family transcriptional regulator n=1 Tax=Pseudomarimonas arenosa TaxID=2774145 RepID=A0AAW3ZGD2_9GAMM|nr:MerR family transcriptional regulator [Pseudomarimonas arenosa]MBD8524364.1 MerR family transcriptional regulator [Pseudomarimonas arenosa]
MFAITDVARLTKVSALTLRTWETRYGVVSPRRATSGLRGYSMSEVRRLNLIAESCRSGFRIGQVAARSTPELAVMMRARRDAWRPQYPEVERLVEAVRVGDVTKIEHELHASLAQRSLSEFADHVLAPWAAKTTQATCPAGPVARERLWSGLLTESLVRMVTQGPTPQVAAAHVLTGALGPERHGVGALICYGLAKLCGAPSINLGVDLRVEDLVEAADLVPSALIALSFVEEVSAQRLNKHLTQLDQQLPSDCRVIIGGRGVSAIQDTLLPSRCLRVRSISELSDVLLLLLSETYAKLAIPGSADEAEDNG